MRPRTFYNEKIIDSWRFFVKLKSLFVVALIAITSSAYAQWFSARVNVVVLPGQVAAEVINPFHQPIICQGQVFGQTSLGPVYTTYFVEQFLPFATNRFAYVQTTPLAPFVGGWANIFCRFAF
jgi:hypothetical protein